MAAIGKIRSWGPVLVGVIGLALFAFIAEEMFRSCQASENEQRQQVGEVLGKKISVQEFQSLLDEYQEAIKLTQGTDNLTDEQQNQLRDQVWNTFVQNTILESECKKLGITVTDQELQNILKEGTNPLLRQTPFVNQQTGLFDVNQLTKFLNDYKSAQNTQLAEQYRTIYNFWTFVEKQLRQSTLAMKYQSLLSGALVSNPVSAKAAFQGQNVETDVLLASLPYSSVNDNDITVSDADLKAKYNEQKEMYRQFVETRDIKYVDFQVQASAADRAALENTINEAAQKLESGAAPSEVVRKAGSQVAYLGLPVGKRALSFDIAQKVDSMSVGQVTKPFETKSDNTLNVVKLISRTQVPDSVQYRVIQVGGASLDEVRGRADSIYNAIKGGAAFADIAKKYQQEGEEQWFTSAMYEGAPSLDVDSKSYIQALTSLQPNEVKNLEMAQGNVILQVLQRKAFSEKYDLAIIKHTIDFSKQTYSDAYNKFSQFVAENTTIEQMEKNAEKFGFVVRDRQDISNAEHNIVGIRSTREALKWLFEAKQGNVSPLYECGLNDHLLVLGLTKIHPEGYRDIDGVKDDLTAAVQRDKKFALLSQKLAGAKTIAEAEKLGAKIDTVRQITFTAPAFIQATGGAEPALSGAVSGVKQGEVSATPVKGNLGAYLFQVLNQAEREGAKLDEKAEALSLQQRAQQAASRFMQELYQKAKVVDNRYLFF